MLLLASSMNFCLIQPILNHALKRYFLHIDICTIVNWPEVEYPEIKFRENFILDNESILPFYSYAYLT